MSYALFVFSTGRCGTQWLAEVLVSALGETAEVAHEPLGDDYTPREMLGAGDDPAGIDPELAELVDEHVSAIEQTLATRNYVECGHPLWSTLPYLLRRLAGRARVVHLVRHPVPTAWSWVTQTAYCPPMGPHVREKVLLSPYDGGVRFPAFRDRWARLTPYEKALFYWAEVNAFGLHLERSVATPWLRVRFEDLLHGDAVARLLAFAGLDIGRAREATEIAHIDEYQAYSEFWCDSRLIANHPEVLQIAGDLGYDPLDFDEGKLRRRYYGR